jgi:hypothetical protein
MKQELASYAANEISKLQGDVCTKAAVTIDIGDVQKLLNRAAKDTSADLLVIGHMLSDGHLGTNGTGYAMIRESHIPVLSM